MTKLQLSGKRVGYVVSGESCVAGLLFNSLHLITRKSVLDLLDWQFA